MAKYRLLTNEELVEMKTEFINYLVVNGITADDWKKTLANDKEKAQSIVDLFSDVVFEKILRKVDYVLRTGKTEIIAFHCKEETIEMCGLIAGEGLDVDFTNHEVVASLIANPVKGLDTITAEKPYSKPREQEIFEMTLDGALISDGNVFKALKSVI